ncbi:MAG: cyclic lactone autoinducer peptide [Clostridia bacterium]|nr:cyclic lactone autoinducer peptide [Clostridia bacterium]
MLKRNIKARNAFGIIASFLIMVAPLIVTTTGSLFFWGEEDCPECLKK